MAVTQTSNKDFHYYLRQAEYLINHGYCHQSVTELAKKLEKIDEEKINPSNSTEAICQK